MVALRFAFLLLAFAPLFARAETSYSRLLARVQATYLNGHAPYPILIMDRDEIEWRFTRTGAVGEGDTEKRVGVIRAYLLEKTGVEVSVNAAMNFEMYLNQLKDAAVAMPALRDGSSTEVALCAVFPPDPNRNRRLENERLVQLGTAEAYGPRQYAELRDSLAYDDAVLFSVLHESGHCLDRYFFPQLLEYGDEPSITHLAESYAETVGLLLMAKEGRTQVAETRAYLRDLYSYFMEPYFAAHPGLGFGSASFPYGGLIYHLSPSIRGAVPDLGRAADLSLPEILSLAQAIVTRSAFDTRTMSALYASYVDGRAAVRERYLELEKDMPDLFAGIPARLDGYWAADDQFRASAFRVAPAPAPTTALAAVPWDEACAALRQSDFEHVRQVAERLRVDLRSGNHEPGEEAQRFGLLSGLWRELPAYCRGAAVRAQKKLSAPIFDLVMPPQARSR